MSFHLSKRSTDNLAGVHPKLIGVVALAIVLTDQDFGVAAKQVRTAEEQNALFKLGSSQKDGYKNKSNHQVTADGTGHSVDLTAWTGTAWDFDDWERYYMIASAMSQAAKRLGVKIKWGGNWYEAMDAYGDTRADMVAAVERYKAKHPGPDFIDGPHFELVA